MKTITPTLAICMVAAGVGVVAAIADLGTEERTSTNTYGGTPTLTIRDFQFSTTLVSPGSTVTVRNLDDAPHTVTADDRAFDSGEISAQSDGSFVAPATPGSYAIHCDLHPSMVAELEVAAP